MTTFAINDPLTTDFGYGTGAITGWITIDGASLDYDITMQYGSISHEFTRVNSGPVAQSGLTATDTSLLFNFDQGNFAIADWQARFNGGPIVSWQSGMVNGYPGGAIVGQLSYINSNEIVAFTPSIVGTQPIGYAVPGPIVGTGLPSLLLVFALLWRKAHDKART